MLWFSVIRDDISKLGVELLYKKLIRKKDSILFLGPGFAAHRLGGGEGENVHYIGKCLNFPICLVNKFQWS